MRTTFLFAVLAVMLFGNIDVSAQGKRDTKNRTVVVVNNSSRDVIVVYGQKADPNNRFFLGKDWIPKDVLKPGQSITVDFDDGRGTCEFDLQAQGPGDDKWTERNFNVCGLSWWDLRDPD